MVLLAAAALLASAPDRGPPPTPRIAQAQASVRIIKAVRITLRDGGGEQQGVPRVRSSTVRTAEGVQPAKLIEFE